MSSLANFSAFAVTSIVKILLLSVVVLRVLEQLSTAVMSVRLFSVFSMESSTLPVLVVGILLEVLSMGFRSISLGFRLFANVSAGHVISDIFGAVKFMTSSGFAPVVTSLVHQFLILGYEICVSVVQTGVFLALVGVYAS